MIRLNDEQEQKEQKEQATINILFVCVLGMSAIVTVAGVIKIWEWLTQ